MIKILNVKGLKIGEGKPKIIVPIVGKTISDILEKADHIKAYQVDVIEWRVDFFEDVMSTDRVLETLNALKKIMPDMPILFTFRTKKEGGEKEISLSEYTLLNKVIAESGLVDFVDVEIFSGDLVVEENIKNIHNAGVLVIGSNHDFFKTPDKADLVLRLRKMQDLGADIPKIAVMPKTVSDVITLLDASQEMYTNFADRLIVTMSMSSLGVISRLAGEVFGSAMTFGAVGTVSAPGQIPADQLSVSLDILHQAL